MNKCSFVTNAPFFKLSIPNLIVQWKRIIVQQSPTKIDNHTGRPYQRGSDIIAIGELVWKVGLESGTVQFDEPGGVKRDGNGKKNIANFFIVFQPLALTVHTTVMMMMTFALVFSVVFTKNN